MKTSKLLIICILLTSAFQAIARKPAVEDFVGVETETYEVTPPGTEVSFNLGNHIVDSTNQSFWAQNAFSFGVTATLLALPFLMWFGLRNASKQTLTSVTAKVEDETEHEHMESGEDSNVASLSDFRDEENQEKKAS